MRVLLDGLQGSGSLGWKGRWGKQQKQPWAWGTQQVGGICGSSRTTEVQSRVEGTTEERALEESLDVCSYSETGRRTLPARP